MTTTRAELCEQTVTLDGRPAKIVGYRNDYATVWQVGTALNVEFAWATVEFVINERDGRFKS